MSRINVQVILDEKQWLRVFLLMRYGDRDIYEGRVERVDLAKLEIAYGRGRDPFRFSHAHLFDKKGGHLCQVGYPFGKKKPWWKLDWTEYMTEYMTESVVRAIMRNQTCGKIPFFLLTVEGHANEAVSFVLSRPPNEYTLVSYAEKILQQARALLHTEEAEIDKE